MNMQRPRQGEEKSYHMRAVNTHQGLAPRAQSYRLNEQRQDVMPYPGVDGQKTGERKERNY